MAGSWGSLRNALVWIERDGVSFFPPLIFDPCLFRWEISSPPKDPKDPQTTTSRSTSIFNFKDTQFFYTIFFHFHPRPYSSFPLIHCGVSIIKGWRHGGPTSLLPTLCFGRIPSPVFLKWASLPCQWFIVFPVAEVNLKSRLCNPSFLGIQNAP